jgi:hypothetical protein
MIVADGKAISARTVRLLRDWTRAGGILIATGTTSLFDPWARKLGDYRMADVFGVAYRETSPEQDVGDIHRYVHREGKPQEGMVSMEILEDDPLLGELRRGDKVEYDGRLSYDRVELKTARALARWPSNDPAVVINEYGRGKVVFITAVCPGLSYTPGNYAKKGCVGFPLQKDFWPGARELLSNVVSGAIEASGSRLPFLVRNCPPEVEVTMRVQQDPPRSVLHFVNYDERIKNIQDIEVEMPLPRSGKFRAFYPETGEEAGHELRKERICLTVRPFAVHEAIVVE